MLTPKRVERVLKQQAKAVEELQKKQGKRKR